jgi:hypothetical protein
MMKTSVVPILATIVIILSCFTNNQVSGMANDTRSPGLSMSLDLSLIT